MILLVSGQPMANLLAALDPALDVGEVHLIVSGDMHAEGRGDWLAQVLEGRGIGCHWHSVSEVFQPDQTRSLVSTLLAASPERFIVNLTGGTKPMALGAYRAAIDSGVRDILYLEQEAGRMRWLEGNRPPVQATAALRITEVLTAHGFKSTPGTSPSDPALAFARHLGAHLEGGLLDAWNRLMFAVERACAKGTAWKPAPVGVALAQSPSPAAAPYNPQDLGALLTEACRRHYCAFAGDTLTIGRAEDHAFLAGGWFELLVWHTLQDISDRAGLHEVVLNLEVRDGAGAANEIDIAAMHGRNLCVLECKTVRLAGRDTGEKAANILYKLEHLLRLGGLGTRLFLVSRQRLEGPIRKRFEAERIGLVDGVGPERLPDALARALEAA